MEFCIPEYVPFIVTSFTVILPISLFIIAVLPDVIIELFISSVPDPLFVIIVLPDVMVTPFISNVPELLLITVPPVFSIFPYVFEPSSPFPLSFINNVPPFIIYVPCL